MISFSFEVHQPFRLCNSNKKILEKVAKKCYIPATKIILDNLDRGFKCSFSLSGLLVEQLEMWCKEALELFQECAKHKNCEFLAQTYFHSISSLFSIKEFEEQVKMHKNMLKEKFGVKPEVFENTELIFNKDVASSAHRMGFKAIYAEGCNALLNGKSPNFVYRCGKIKVLVRNYQLSDDIAFRFSCKSWNEYPLTAEKYAEWLSKTPRDCINIFIDYETFGEHHWKESGILEFLKYLPEECESKGIKFALPSEIAKIKDRGELKCDKTTSWADLEKDISAWAGNEMQKSAIRAIRDAEIYAIDEKSKRKWRILQTSDHFYYMSTKSGSCGEVHSYFSQSDPYTAFEIYMKTLNSFEENVLSKMPENKRKKILRILRTVPPEKAFHFFEDGKYICSAYSLSEFAEKLKGISGKCIEEHKKRGDFENWIAEVVGDKELAEKLSNVHSPVDVVFERVCELWKRLK